VAQAAIICPVIVKRCPQQHQNGSSSCLCTIC